MNSRVGSRQSRGFCGTGNRVLARGSAVQGLRASPGGPHGAALAGTAQGPGPRRCDYSKPWRNSCTGGTPATPYQPVEPVMPVAGPPMLRTGAASPLARRGKPSTRGTAL